MDGYMGFKDGLQASYKLVSTLIDYINFFIIIAIILYNIC